MSGSLTLVVDHRAAALRLEGGALRVELTHGFRRAPLALLDRVVVHGAVPVACDVWRALAERGIGTVMLPGRGRGAVAFSGAGLAPFVPWRLRQYAAFMNAERRLEMTRAALRLKLDAFRRRAGKLPKGAESMRIALVRALDDIEVTRDANALRGVEGAAAARWFATLANNVSRRWKFSGRSRRPPRDPFNALLSLGYTLALSEVRMQVLAQGLDPALGFLHTPAPAREALALDALDALEPLRAAVDGIALTLLEHFELTDFTCSQADGCRLSKQARGRFYALWTQACTRDFGGLFVDVATEDTVQDQDVEYLGADSESDFVPVGSLAAAAVESVRRLRRALPEAPTWDA